MEPEMEEKLARLRARVAKLPTLPGVYIMKDKTGKVIYVGKAKSLRNRVSSYFRSVEKHLPKVYRMVCAVQDFDYIVTDSEFEALVLECSMIKEYNPKYNILLKDDKGYSYIKIAPREWGKITAVKQRLEDDAEYIGPYISNFVVSQTVDEANKVFRLPSCNRKFPQEIGKGRPCLNYYIQQCMGPCRGRISKAEYEEALAQAVEYIKNGSARSVEELTKKMEQAAENLEFEKAARYRDRIGAISRSGARQKVVFTKTESADVLAVASLKEQSCISVLRIRGERLVDKQDFLIGEIETLPLARTQFLLRYYSQGELPREVVLDGDCEDRELVERYLSEKAGRKVALLVPQRGERAQLMEMARTNAAQTLSHQTARTGREVAGLDELGRLLGLRHPPAYIEAYDISNIGSATMVAGMVVFEEGRPLKSAYKKFNIKTLSQNDDYGAMREVLTRRFSHYEQEKESGRGFGRLPDLILLDGGAGHVAAIQPVLRSFGLDIPLFGMVKDDKHRTRAIAADGGEIAIASHRSAFTLVGQIQEEVHRFAITYSRSKHRKSGLELAITGVEGIGPARAKALYGQFKTLKAIKAASVEELAAVKGMGRSAAQRLYDSLHPQAEGQEPGANG